MKRITTFLLFLLLWTLSGAQTPKYIFYFIGDGMGIHQVQLTNAYNAAAGLPALNFSAFPVQTFVATQSASGLVTDSAAAGTALSTGTKTTNYYMGADPDGAPLRNLSERARQHGKGVGIVTSTSVNHATPGAFFAHTTSRRDFKTISTQMLACQVDFLGGAGILREKDDTLGRDYWLNRAKEAGWEVCLGKDTFRTRPGKRMLCLPEKDGKELSYAIDAAGGELRLQDLTRAAIDHLYANYRRKGFFLMVEGGLIDYLCHSNDPGGAVHEINDMAQSVELALQFLAAHPHETLIIVTADHETGGMAYAYDRRTGRPEWLSGQTCSMRALSGRLAALKKESGENTPWIQVKDLLRESLGLWESVQPTAAKEKQLKQLYKESFLDNGDSREADLYTTAERLARYAVSCLGWGCGVKWLDNNHTGSPVGLYVKGAGQAAFAACRDNTDIPNTLVRVAGLQ